MQLNSSLKRWAIKKENFKEILVSKFLKFGEKYAFTEAGSLATPKEDKYKEPHICISESNFWRDLRIGKRPKNPNKPRYKIQILKIPADLSEQWICDENGWISSMFFKICCQLIIICLKKLSSINGAEVEINFR